VIREYNFNIHAPKRKTEENGQQPPRGTTQSRETLIYFEKNKNKK
jgi:hypothetical protein